MSKKGSTSYQIDPRVYQAQSKMMDLAEDWENKWETEYYPMLLNQTEKQNELTQELARNQMDDALWWRNMTQTNTDKALAREDAMWKQYQQTQGAENYIADAAQNYNQGAVQERLTEGAMADLTAQYAVDRKNLGQALTASGVDPTSGRFMASMRSLSDAQANAMAQGQIQAYRAAKQLGWDRRTTATGIGQNLFNQSVNYANQALNTANTGSQAAQNANSAVSAYAQQIAANNANLLNSAQSNMQSQQQYLSNIFNLGMGSSSTAMGGISAQNQANAGIANAYGQAGGAIAGATAARVAGGE